MTLAELMSCFRRADCVKAYVKYLAGNDNSKNQVYLGPSFGVLNIIPNLQIKPSQSGTRKDPIFKASVKFSWLGDDGCIYPAPHSQLIFYPQYPEVRFSGFLLGCSNPPSKLMNCRLNGRILLIGVKADGTVLGYVASSDSIIAHELGVGSRLEEQGVFKVLPFIKDSIEDSRTILLSELRRIHNQGWIRSKRLLPDGRLGSCEAPQCGGYTLEAELGVRPNGFSEPDFRGWEVKQHNVSNFTNISVGVITLITPEPTLGYYAEKGVIPFVKKFGYADKKGRQDRLNFGGIHRAGLKNELTGLRLELVGYDAAKGKIVDENGGISLISPRDECAASWPFAGLMEHWNRKHAKAVYVPSMSRCEANLQYYYGDRVKLGEGTDFLKFLGAFADGKIYYDPGIKVENVSTSPKPKKRSQFRVHCRDLECLYTKMTVVSL